MTPRVPTQVAIVGAGPAGLVLANVLHQAGVAVCLLERTSRPYLEQRARAGLLEHRVVEYLHALGLAGGLFSGARRHGWCEISCLGERVRIDYAALSGGDHHWVYPQQFLVRDLIAKLIEARCPPRFGHSVSAIELPDCERPVVRCSGLDVRCDYVVGCDGTNGRVIEAFPGEAARADHRRYPYDWLTVLAEMTRPVDGVRYALHDLGFAGIMPRSGRTARLYLQVPQDDSQAEWPDMRIREQLQARMASGPQEPRVIRILKVGMLRMRGRVQRCFQHGQLFLAGDSAHLLTPSGAKGMNLAIADAADLARAFISHYQEGDSGALDSYSDRRIDAAWRMQDFSDELLRLLHLPQLSPDEREFALRLRLERVRRLAEPGPHAAAFARAYAGSGTLCAEFDRPGARQHDASLKTVGSSVWRS